MRKRSRSSPPICIMGLETQFRNYVPEESQTKRRENALQTRQYLADENQQPDKSIVQQAM